MWCLPKEQATKVKQALKSGELNPDKLNSIQDSKERRSYIAKISGEENAKQINLLFEQKLLLKNQEKAMIDWAKQITGISNEEKELAIKKIKDRIEERQQKIYNPKENEKMLDEVVSDIYSRKYKTEVSLEQSNHIIELSKQIKETESKMRPDFTFPTKEDALKAGSAKRALQNYVTEIKSGIPKEGWVNPFKESGFENKVSAIITDTRASFDFIARTSRQLVATIDNSFWGNQGIKVMWNPKYNKSWASNFAQSFKDIKNILVKGVDYGDQIKDATYADYYSRNNFLNGKYTSSIDGQKSGKVKLDVGTGEEELVTGVFENLSKNKYISKIPLLKQAFEGFSRLAKAADVAYETGAMRLRMDVADKMYSVMEKSGKNINDNIELSSINTIINSMTGRGGIGKFELAGEPINMAVFSIKFAKSNFDFLTAHIGSKDIPVKYKLEALKNLGMVISSIGLTLGIANILDPDSTDLDSRSPKFGKLYGQDITGGMSSFVTLATRIARQSTKSSTTGLITPLGNEYGQMNGMDIFWQFTENKASPLFSLLRDLVRQQTFEGDKPTLFNELQNITTPISIGNSEEILSNKDDNMLLKVLGVASSMVGFNKSIFKPKTNWEENDSKELTKFRDKVGNEQFKKANQDFNDEFGNWLNIVNQDIRYLALSDEDKKEVVTKKKEKIKNSVLNKYR